MVPLKVFTCPFRSYILFYLSVANLLAKLLCASRIASAKIECSFKMGKQIPLGAPIYFAVDGI